MAAACGELSCLHLFNSLHPSATIRAGLQWGGIMAESSENTGKAKQSTWPLLNVIVSLILALAVWWIGPGYYTGFDEIVWGGIGLGVFVGLLLIFSLVRHLTGFNSAFEIVRAPYLLLMQPFRLFEFIEERFKEIRVSITSHTGVGIAVGSIVWLLVIAVPVLVHVPSKDQCKNGCVVLAELQGDDISASRTDALNQAIAAAHRRAGLGATNVVILPRLFFRLAWGNAGIARQTALLQAKTWIDWIGGNDLIYGEVKPGGKSVFVDTVNTRNGGHPVSEGLTLPVKLDDGLGNALALFEASSALPVKNDDYVSGTVWPLAKALKPYVAALPKTLSAETAGQVLTIYAFACDAVDTDERNDEAVEQAVFAYHQILDLGIGARDAALSRLGKDLGLLGERQNGAEKFALAARIYQEAVAESKQGEVRLQESVDAFRQVAAGVSRAKSPAEWAEAQNNLGNALGVLGQRTLDLHDNAGALARLNEAESAFLSAQAEYAALKDAKGGAAAGEGLAKVRQVAALIQSQPVVVPPPNVQPILPAEPK
jgi:hypothetical protein